MYPPAFRVHLKGCLTGVSFEIVEFRYGALMLNLDFEFLFFVTFSAILWLSHD